MKHFAWRCFDAEPNRLVTLTVDTKLWSRPRAAYDGTKSDITKLATKLRRRYDEFEYFKVLEVTKKGWPHYHLIVRSPYIPHQQISTLWEGLTGAPIVDVRQIKKARDIFFYVMKYLAKQKYIPWTNRRVSWTKHFFPTNQFQKGTSLDLTSKGWFDDHPSEVVTRYYRPLEIQIYSQDCWTVDPDLGYEIGRRPGQFRNKHSDN